MENVLSEFQYIRLNTEKPSKNVVSVSCQANIGYVRKSQSVKQQMVGYCSDNGCFFASPCETSSLAETLSISIPSFSNTSSWSSSQGKSLLTSSCSSSSTAKKLSPASTMSTMPVPMSWAPVKPPRRVKEGVQTDEEIIEQDDTNHVITIKISGAATDSDVDCHNVQRHMIPVPPLTTPSPPPPPSLDMTSLSSDLVSLPPPPSFIDTEESNDIDDAITEALDQLENVDDNGGTWLDQILTLKDEDNRKDGDLDDITPESLVAAEFEAHNEVTEYR